MTCKWLRSWRWGTVAAGLLSLALPCTPLLAGPLRSPAPLQSSRRLPRGLPSPLLTADPITPAATTCPRSGVVGVARLLPVAVEGGLKVGLKSYPQTLPLADHEVVLTFDDGPAAKTTASVLEALRRECVTATFFLIGRKARRHRELVRREVAEGHTVGHHSWSHPAVTLRGLSRTAALAEVTKGMQAVDGAGWGGATASGRPHVPFFRFPGLADTEPLLQSLARQKIAVFSTDLWASDWRPMTPQTELRLILQRLEQSRRGMILLHDSRPQTAAMLPDFLRALRIRGYRVVHLTPASR